MISLLKEATLQHTPNPQPALAANLLVRGLARLCSKLEDPLRSTCHLPTSTKMPYVASPSALIDFSTDSLAEERVSLLDHSDDSVQRHYLGEDDAEAKDHTSETHIETCSTWTEVYDNTAECTCHRNWCKWRHQDVFGKLTEPGSRHLWEELPNTVYKGIVSRLDWRSLLSFRLACRA